MSKTGKNDNRQIQMLISVNLEKNLTLFKEMTADEILDQRENKFLKIGRGKGCITNPESLTTLETKRNIMDQFLNRDKKKIYFATGFILIMTVLMIFIL